MQQVRLLVWVVLPFTVAMCFSINTYILGHEDFAWNRMGIASQFYISLLLLIFINLIILACKPSHVDSGYRRSELLLLILSLVKATFGKTVYAFSLTSHWGQSDLNSYDSFLAVASNAGLIGGHQMIMSTITLLLPALFAVISFKTQDSMSENSLCYWKKAKQRSGNGDSALISDMKRGAPSEVSPKYDEPKIITIANACVVCWYTWNVFMHFPGEDLIVTFVSSVICATTCLRCLPFSFEVMDICSAIMSNDLTLECNSPQNRDKSE